MGKDYFVVVLESSGDKSLFGLLSKKDDKFEVVREGDLGFVVGNMPPHPDETRFNAPVGEVYSDFSKKTYSPKDLSSEQVRDYQARYVRIIGRLSH